MNFDVHKINRICRRYFRFQCCFCLLSSADRLAVDGGVEGGKRGLQTVPVPARLLPVPELERASLCLAGPLLRGRLSVARDRCEAAR